MRHKIKVGYDIKFMVKYVLVPTFRQIIKNSPYICFIVILVPQVFSVSNIGLYCEILVDWTDGKSRIDATQTYLMTWTHKE
jgi:hypothetical protein